MVIYGQTDTILLHLIVFFFNGRVKQNHCFNSWTKSLRFKLVNPPPKKRKRTLKQISDTKAFCLSPTRDDLEERTELPLFLLRLPLHRVLVTKQNIRSLAKSQSGKVHGWLTLLAVVINNGIGSGIWTLESIVFLSQSLSPFNQQLGCRLQGFLPALMGQPCSHQVIILSIIKQEVHLGKRIPLHHHFPFSQISFSEPPIHLEHPALSFALSHTLLSQKSSLIVCEGVCCQLWFYAALL